MAEGSPWLRAHHGRFDVHGKYFGQRCTRRQAPRAVRVGRMRRLETAKIVKNSLTHGRCRALTVAVRVAFT